MVKTTPRVTIEWDEEARPGKCPGTITFHRGAHVIAFQHIAFPEREREVRSSQKFNDEWKPTTVRRVCYTYPKASNDAQTFAVTLGLVLLTGVAVFAYLVATGVIK